MFPTSAELSFCVSQGSDPILGCPLSLLLFVRALVKPASFPALYSHRFLSNLRDKCHLRPLPLQNNADRFHTMTCFTRGLHSSCFLGAPLSEESYRRIRCAKSGLSVLAIRELRACRIQSQGCRCVAFGNVFAGEG